ncbi:MAG: hypothetical protein JW931_04835 [Methanomicrobiaceae archaeon]|nr:hypothetical protein [Methanomicrobiaceae archaeon]
MTLKLPGIENKDIAGEKRKTEEKGANIPAALPVTVDIGLFAKNGGMNKETLEALNLILQKLESLLSHTPHKFRFLMALSQKADIDIVRQVRSCIFWENKAPPDVILFRHEGGGELQEEFFTG